jgi:AcrR family transcriptional regulator
MPRSVDLSERKRKIVHALWKLISVHGLESASMRNVAHAAHMSTGQLQHYFKTRDDLLEYAIALLSEQAQERIEAKLGALPTEPSPDTVLRECLYDVLGLDSESRLTVLVHIAFFASILSNPHIFEAIRKSNDTLYTFTADLIIQAQADGRCLTTLDPVKESYGIWSLTVSLGMDLALGNLEEDEAIERLEYYFSKIFIKPS